MANAVQKVNGIDIGDIQAINGVTDDNLQALNTLEFTGTIPDAHTFIGDNSSDTTNLTDITFSSGIGSTYDVYIFDFINLNAATDNVSFTFQVNAVGDSGYNNSNITSVFSAAFHDEDDSGAGVGADANRDNDGTTDETLLEHYIGTEADEGISGRMWLYAPSSDDHVKNFIAELSTNARHDANYVSQVAGYIDDDDTAIDDIRFKMSSGNFDGLIRMYGIAKS